jgi:hypothetical protein
MGMSRVRRKNKDWQLANRVPIFSVMFVSAFARRLAVGLYASLGVLLLAAAADNRVPDKVRYKSGYINPVPKPPDFTSAMLWGIAIADTQLTCRADGKNIILNDDSGNVRGGLYRRHPWFGTDVHDPMPIVHSEGRAPVILRVGTRPDRVWHFWAASPRASLPTGHFEGCTVRVKVRISRGALLQIGMDYWRNPTIGYGPGGNNHEGGASDWYFPSDDWQEAVFTDGLSKH